MPTHEGNEHNSSLPSTRPFSIDLSLELERQLDNDSQPPTPAHDVTETPSARESLDPHVLASIILQLRHSLAQATKEKDDLSALVPSLKDSLEHMTNKCTTMEEELHEARAKAKDDEEAISLLRSKVEESRRGLMRLQTESRRASAIPAPIDISRAGLPAFGALGSNKRQSFTPMTGKMNFGTAHKRTSSASEGAFPVDILIHAASPSPSCQVFSCETPGHPPPSSTRRLSGFFGRTSPSQNDHGPSYDAVAHELDGLRRELQSVKDELEDTKHELTEAREMRDASETCVRALREFIAENNIGVTTSVAESPVLVSNPRLDSARKPTGWGFTNLFKPEGTKPSPVVSSTPAPSRASEEQSPIIPTKKFGGFFSSRASVSSTTSQPPQPPLARDISGSDASSIEESAEPVSPTNENAGGNIIVSSGRASPSFSSATDHPMTVTSKGPTPDAVVNRMETISLV